MEKKFERVPYISKWYKWKEDCSGEHFRLDVERTNQYLKNELLHFDFKDEPTTEETAKELNNCFKNVCFTAGINWDVDNVTTTINYCKPISPALKFVCHLTQWDIDDLKTRLQLAMQHNSLIIDGKYNNGNIIKKDDINRIIKLVNTRMQDVIDYLDNNNDIREKCQKDQLVRLEEQSKPKKSYEGTLAEHWKELMDLFEIKNNEGLDSLNDFVKSYEICKKRNIEFRVLCITDDNSKISLNKQEDDAHKLYYIYETLGIDFIKDFIKACEKCEN